MNRSTKATETPPSLLSRISIQQRLPLLIGLLLLVVIAAFGLTSYYHVKKAARSMTVERLKTIKEQLTDIFSQSAQMIITSTSTAAQQDIFRKYLLKDTLIADSAVKIALSKLRSDSTWPTVSLINDQKQELIRSSLNSTAPPLPSDSILNEISLGPELCKVGKLYQSNGSVFYPIVAAITQDQKVIGYILRWRLQKTTERSITQFSRLLGDHAMLYIGNADGSLWTDLHRVVPGPPKRQPGDSSVFQYQRAGFDTDVLATTSPLPNSQWQLLIESSQERVAEAGSRFLDWILLFGSLLLVAGLVMTWLIVRNITLPLNKLNDAASEMANGNYLVSVETHRGDEIGQLAQSFNKMAVQVSNARTNLEQKVHERTAQFEEANKELESFSYSVSHDLRAPLRIINGYTDIVTMDYGHQLDDEGRKMLGVIAANARKMGRLIDDLLNLSRMGRKELTMNRVNMQKLVETVVSEMHLPEQNRPIIKIGTLLEVDCDSSLMRQVWVNLISNAVKYSGKKQQPVIEIDSEKVNDNVVFRVRDNGVGFDMQYADKLFGVFQRLHKASDYEGTGVGLALVHRIISKHGGKVWADAEVDQGASFYFSVPVQKVFTHRQVENIATL